MKTKQVMKSILALSLAAALAVGVGAWQTQKGNLTGGESDFADKMAYEGESDSAEFPEQGAGRPGQMMQYTEDTENSNLGEELQAAVNWIETEVKDCYRKTEAAEEVITVNLDEKTADVMLTKAGTYRITGTLTEGSLICDIPEDGELHLILQNVTVGAKDGPAIWIKNGKRCVLTIEGENVLSDTAGEAGSEDKETKMESDADTPTACLWSKCDLGINGTGSMRIVANNQDGIVCKDDLVMVSGNYVIQAEGNGIKGVDSLLVLDGNYTIAAGEDGLKASQDEKENKGWVCIEGGSFLITAGDDGIHGETILQIEGGQIEIQDSYEGLEAAVIGIWAGTIRVKAQDDGINVSDSNGLFCMCGGDLTVDADGDGIDSNGSIYMSGGNILVLGPEKNGNGALDYDKYCLLDGGSLLAVGSVGMAQGNSPGSNQIGMLINLEKMYDQGSKLTILNSQNQELISTVITKTYQSVAFSCPELEENETYRLMVDGEEVCCLTLEDHLTTYGSSGRERMWNHGPQDGSRDFPREKQGDFSEKFREGEPERKGQMEK